MTRDSLPGRREVSPAKFGYRCPRCGARCMRIMLVPGLIAEDYVCGACEREVGNEMAVYQSMVSKPISIPKETGPKA